VRIRTVTAHAFGPLVAQTMTFADGLTVVHGPNESAKSSWHAAVYAALCGRRRGVSSAEERRFEARHRPWDREDWLVSAQIVLDDGRRVELRQDLAGRVDCHAIDLDLATDLSAEILNGGMPDASRWLGLDRRSFAATASIAQAAMLAVLEHPTGLQEHLQRAADTAGADATAAAAIRRIDDFHKEHVGADRVTAVRPLRTAIVAEHHAMEHIAEARALRTEYERALAAAGVRRDEAAAAQITLRRHEAAAARTVADRLQAQAREATELDSELSGTRPDLAAEDQLANRVAAAVATWRSSAAAVARAAAYAAERGDLSDSAPKDGDTAEPGLPGEKEPTVDGVETTAEPDARADPPGSVEPAAGSGAPFGVDGLDDELWELARRLDLRREPADPTVKQRFHAARARVVAIRVSQARGRWVAVGGAVFVLAAVALAILNRPLYALGALAIGAGVLVAAYLIGRGGALGPAQAELAAAELAHAAAEQSAHDALHQRRTAEARAAELGVPAEPAALRALFRAQAGVGRDQQWQARLDDAHGRASEELMAVAQECGIGVASPEDAAAALEKWSLERVDRTARAQRARDRWARRVALLDGRELGELVAAAQAAQRRADAARADLGDDEPALLDDAQVARARAVAQQAAAAAGEAQGALAERERSLPSVAEAEEALARAEAELARVRELDRTLRLTRQFLVSAQERAHRDIAPVLAETVRRSLPTVTDGRYHDVIVDPRTLGVRVCGPSRRWRAADQLSHGTAEQVYLLLRLALARHLVRDGTSCPILLDDVTVHADGRRVSALLDLLREAAQDHQIVLFTQQDQVLEWARANLRDPRHAIRELPALESA
jgi:hypothetical protein